MKFTATAPPGLQSLLAEELTALGADKLQAQSGSVSFEGDLAMAYRVCLWSRVANRVLMPLTAVKTDTPEALYASTREIRWERHLRSDGSLAVDVAGRGTGITHSRYAAQRVKDAVVDRFREQFGERPSVDTEQPDIRIHLFLRGDRGRLSLDLSGGSLHRRGYRQAGALAPMKENLAAALLMLAGWPEIAARGGALLDPLCGSATLLIEGAWMAADMAPGLLREHYGFLHWKRHDADAWQALLDEARKRGEAGLARLPPILGFDKDRRALQAAWDNLAQAGLAEHVQVRQQNLSADLPLPDLRDGLLISNPPYGERLGDTAGLRPLYATLGELLRGRLPNWRGAVFSGNPELANVIGLRPAHSHALDNGGIPCRLLVFESGADHAAVAEQHTAPDEQTLPFANRVKKNLKHLGRWARREDVDCYRVYDQDLPEFALAVDIYQGREGRYAHVQEYQAPKEIDADKAANRRDQALALLPGLLEIPPANVFLKLRRQQKKGKQYEKQAHTGRQYEVREGEARLLVNFTDYLDTGLFLDHRPLRRRLHDEAKDKRFLNLFCYTATATVQAALGGAKASTSVDLSHTYLDWARRNFALNGMDEKAHQLVQADVLAWLEEARKRLLLFDLIFCDPPTLSRSKRMEGELDVQRDQLRIIDGAMALLKPGGSLCFSNNFRKFRLDEEVLSRWQVEDISPQTIGEDFKRRPNIHRCWRIRHR